VHHVATNSLGHDPDIQHLPLIAVDPGFFASVFSFYHNRMMPFDAAARLMVRYQVNLLAKCASLQCK
jgi:hypothetical protein